MKTPARKPRGLNNSLRMGWRPSKQSVLADNGQRVPARISFYKSLPGGGLFAQAGYWGTIGGEHFYWISEMCRDQTHGERKTAYDTNADIRELEEHLEMQEPTDRPSPESPDEEYEALWCV